MGASHSHTTLSSWTNNESLVLEGSGISLFQEEERLYPGSGRMMRTFRVRSGDVVAVVKSMWVRKDHQDDVEREFSELKRIQSLLAGQKNVAPFLFWSTGDYHPNNTRPVYIMRSHLYTTLSDRMACRPFLTTVEKLFIAKLTLKALSTLHSRKIVHGFITTENIGLNSWHWVVLLDLASYKHKTGLADDDPSDFLYYFQELVVGGESRREKRCYIAPERFGTPAATIAPTMDIFSLGCILLELFLNGERALELGDLMEYRKKKAIPPTLQQKLNKIESSHLRAACRHMLHLEPSQRLTTEQYLERLEETCFPATFATLGNLLERIVDLLPDARLAMAAAQYDNILWETMGVRTDTSGYFKTVLGPTMVALLNGDSPPEEKDDQDSETNTPTQRQSAERDLYAETEALLKSLEALSVELSTEEVGSSPVKNEMQDVTAPDATGLPQHQVPQSERTPGAKSSLLIYLQLVLSTVSQVQRPSSRIVALQLMAQLGAHVGDEARLQRIVPVTTSLLHDQDPIVKAFAVLVLTKTVSRIQSFPPSDSNVFPQYIFKRVAHMITDPSLVVRLAFAQSVAVLAETSLRFLDISHAVRLYEAVGGTPTEKVEQPVFEDDVTKLLGPSLNKKTQMTGTVLGSNKTLITSTYNDELTVLHETVSRWVVHITTDQSEHSSPPKRALLTELARLCTFFGLDGVMDFVLPQILAFLNDRKDWQLRAALFERLPALCHFIGRVATEHIVLPCLESALVDSEDTVISRALHCLSELIDRGLLSRSVLVGNSTGQQSQSSRLLHKYAPLLLYPAADVRHGAFSVVLSSCRAFGFPDSDVYIVPILKPFLRFHPSPRHLETREGLELCLHPPWSRQKLQDELSVFIAARKPTVASSTGQWTSIGVHTAGLEGSSSDKNKPANQKGDKDNEQDSADPKPSQIPPVQLEHVREYLRMLARGRTHVRATNHEDKQSSPLLHTGIEGSLKLEQDIKFPRQDAADSLPSALPSWYGRLRNQSEELSSAVSEFSAIRSVAELDQVYGLSVMNAAETADQMKELSEGTTVMTSGKARDLLCSPESKTVEAACIGEWGSVTSLDPTLADTSLLVTKLNALQVPPLPPKLSGQLPDDGLDFSSHLPNKDTADWKPKVDALIASSSSVSGHTAPVMRIAVSFDQRFFVSASYDGSCRLWELAQIEEAAGVLESSISYTGHSEAATGVSPRINDVAMVEGSHSVVSGSSDGKVHVWRVDMVSPSNKTPSSQNDSRDTWAIMSSKRERSRAVGNSMIREVDAGEGEVLAVSHFNSAAASIVTFATQKGLIHSWDLRCATEPFALRHSPEIGFLTSMALGSDRNWMVTGSSNGFIALWDLRFQKMMKLWQHSQCAPITRLASSFVQPPQAWGGKTFPGSEPRPFIFAACGSNECSMFDIIDGSCRESFRTVALGLRRGSNAFYEDLPSLNEVHMSANRRSALTSSKILARQPETVSSAPSINAMVGSIGAHDQSYLITGGSDCRIRFWDFSSPSRCYVVGGQAPLQPRPTFDRFDFDGPCRLMLCEQAPTPGLGDLESARRPSKLFQGLKKPDNFHSDSIQDLKIVQNALISCSRDCTIKVWR